MAKRLFGTDGIRGRANSEPMTAETALRVGCAAGRYFRRGNRRHRVVIGKDTRLSGYMIEPALTAGFVATGMDPILVGPLPTPAVAHLTKSLRADLGVMISASHNPYDDNGIKLFGPDGYKLSDEAEDMIEALMQDDGGDERVDPDSLGRALRLDDARGRYVEAVKQSFPKGLGLSGMRIVVDCANGAAYKVAPEILWELGADVIPVGVEPDGFNINRGCGSTNPELMCQAVITHGADMGIALDGDADRVVVCDAEGTVLDGDQIMGTLATHWRRADRLRGDTLVVTVMSNLGLERFLHGRGIKMLRTQVGDRYVTEAMREHGFNLGGEQSGHIIFGDYATTGDGLLAALQLLAVVRARDKPVGEVCRVFEPFPQTLRNVRYGEGSDPLAARSVVDAVAEGETRLADKGRVLIRRSGTEPLVRIMVEGEDETVVREVVDQIVRAVEATL